MLEDVSVFSIRHRRALAEGKIDLDVDDPRLRGRLWRVMQKYNESWHYQPDPSDNWTEETDCFEQVEKVLLDTSGESELKFSLDFWFKSTNARASVLDAI